MVFMAAGLVAGVGARPLRHPAGERGRGARRGARSRPGVVRRRHAPGSALAAPRARLAAAGAPRRPAADAAGRHRRRVPGLPRDGVSVSARDDALSATDAALGQKVVTDASVPARVRQALDVESGLNDGLAVPFFCGARHRQRGARWRGVRLGRPQQSRFADRLGSRRRPDRGRRRRPALRPRRAPRMARRQLAADRAAGRRRPRLRHLRRPRRQRLHRRLRRRHGVRPRLEASTEPPPCSQRRPGACSRPSSGSGSALSRSARP